MQQYRLTTQSLGGSISQNNIGNNLKHLKIEKDIKFKRQARLHWLEFHKVLLESVNDLLGLVPCN